MMPISRREFSRGIAIAAMAPAFAMADSPVARLFRSLGEKQRAILHFPFDHPLRTVIRNNWAVVKPTIGDLSKPQQDLCREILKDVCSEDGFERFRRVMNDDFGGFERYHVAVFGEPEGPCEWVLTGRHVTIRGNLRGEVAGPVFYGHSLTNAWSIPSQTSGKIFNTLADHQKVRGTKLDSSALDDRQNRMVEELLTQFGSPFRRLQIAATDKWRLAFHGRDVWKLEGPGFSWHFHGLPHVHCWLEIGELAG